MFSYLVGHEKWHALLEEGERRVGVSELRRDVHQRRPVLRARRHVRLVLVDEQLDDDGVALLRGDV